MRNTTSQQFKASFETFIAAGSIRNVEFNDEKRNLGHAIEKASRLVNDALHVEFKATVTGINYWDTNEVFETIHDAHSVQFAAKKCANHKNKLVNEFFAEWAPICAMLKALKPMIVKGRIPTVIDPRSLENTGTCGCCQRNVKLNQDGSITNHGYKVRNSSFENECFGCRYAPDEVSSACLVALIKVTQTSIHIAQVSAEAYAKKTTEELVAEIARRTENKTKYPHIQQPYFSTVPSIFQSAKIAEYRMEEKYLKADLIELNRRLAVWQPRALPDGCAKHMATEAA